MKETKNSSYKLHRPLVWAVIYYMIGIIGGTIGATASFRSLFFFSFFTLILIAILYGVTKSKQALYLSACIVLGCLRVISHPVETEAVHLEGYITLSGTVQSKEQSSFNHAIVLKNVAYSKKTEVLPLQSKIKVVSQQSLDVEEGNQVILLGKVKPATKVYNPSDMDYETYLKSQGIVCEVQLQELQQIIPTSNSIAKVRKGIKSQIHTLFQERDKGLVNALILGDKTTLEERTKDLYRTLGISHLLALSGLHLSLASMILWYLLGRIGFGYGMRNSISIIGIWSYCLVTGGSVSTVRAAIMLSVVWIIRTLWEEEDFLTTCAIAALIVLGLNPFELYQVGFQLSFMAIVGISMIQVVYRFMKYGAGLNKMQIKIGKIVVPSILLSLVLNPVLAYHFFEVPLLGILINILIVPLFSLLIPVLFLLLGISLILPSWSSLLAQGIVVFLNSIESIGLKLIQLPFVTEIVGRPTWVQLILYYAGIGIAIMGSRQQILKRQKNRVSVEVREDNYLKDEKEIERRTLGMKLRERTSKLNLYYTLATLCLVGAIVFKAGSNKLEIMHLYIGQGDCCVITTPTGKTLLMDSGPEQKSDTLLRYLKYKGVKEVDLAIVSHPHEDHIGGLIQLMEAGMKVNQVAWADDKMEDLYKERLIALCEQQQVPLHALYRGDRMALGDLEFQVLWPPRQMDFKDVNEASLVCLFNYKEVTELFTGDIGFQTEMRLLPDLIDIDLLKVAHHGSKNSTSSKFIEKVSPEYGMISAGVANRYGHPHSFTLERLLEEEVKMCITSEQGAIRILTDGLTYRVETQVAGGY